MLPFEAPPAFPRFSETGWVGGWDFALAHPSIELGHGMVCRTANQEGHTDFSPLSPRLLCCGVTHPTAAAPVPPPARRGSERGGPPCVTCTLTAARVKATSAPTPGAQHAHAL